MHALGIPYAKNRTGSKVEVPIGTILVRVHRMCIVDRIIKNIDIQGT